jgi:hypothetical protein
MPVHNPRFAFTLQNQAKPGLGLYHFPSRSYPVHDENTTCPTAAQPSIVLPDFRPKLIC